MRCVTLSVLALALLAGCSTFENEAQSQFHDSGHWDTSGRVSVTTGDVRVVTSRKHPESHQLVVCTEPSPDVAKAISSAIQVTGKASDNKISAEGSLQANTAQSLTALAGRSTALLALRDGLYHACEAYANGALGADAYALVLARYGQLMTTLFLAQDITDIVNKHSEALAVAQSPQLKVGAPGGDTTGQPNAADGADKKSTSGDGSTPGAPSSAGAAGALAPGDPPGAAPNGRLDPASAPTPAASATDTSSAVSVGLLSLVRMMQDYVALDRNPVQLLLVACINYSDQSHIEPKNEWLEGVCKKTDSVQGISALLSGAVDEESKVGRPGPLVDPTVALRTQSTDGATPGALKATHSSTATTAATPPSNAQIKAAQATLRTLGYNVGAADGLMGPKTRDAVRLFQVAKGFAPTGSLDAGTLAALGVPLSGSAAATGARS
jgi:hypothetical protein